MKEITEFSFGDDSVAQAYDKYLVPALFDPWAFELIKKNQPWGGKCVLDLAAGTGVVSKHLSQQVGSEGKVTAVDINGQMLNLARKRCESVSVEMEFIESSVDDLSIQDNSIDIVICQQGFQFFPDKNNAAKEIFRVLQGDGKAIITTWCPVEECQFFGSICEALESMGENEISKLMRVPFDFLDQSGLLQPFIVAGFNNVQVSRQEKNLIIEGGIDEAVEFAYATPIGPKLRELTKDKQSQFRFLLLEISDKISIEKSDMGRMVSNVLTAEK